MSAMSRLPRGRHHLPPEQVRETQFQRLVHANLCEVGERGYRETSVARIIRRAGVSRATFYEIFDDRADCYRAAVEHLVSDFDSALAPEKRAESRACVTGRFDDLLCRMRALPAGAQVLFSDAIVSCPDVARIQHEAIERWSRWLDEACSGVLMKGADPKGADPKGADSKGADPMGPDSSAISREDRARMAFGAAIEVALHEEAKPDDLVDAAMMPYRRSPATTFD